MRKNCVNKICWQILLSWVNKWPKSLLMNPWTAADVSWAQKTNTHTQFSPENVPDSTVFWMSSLSQCDTAFSPECRQGKGPPCSGWRPKHSWPNQRRTDRVRDDRDKICSSYFSQTSQFPAFWEVSRASSCSPVVIREQRHRNEIDPERRFNRAFD